MSTDEPAKSQPDEPTKPPPAEPAPSARETPSAEPSQPAESPRSAELAPTPPAEQPNLAWRRLRSGFRPSRGQAVIAVLLASRGLEVADALEVLNGRRR